MSFAYHVKCTNPARLKDCMNHFVTKDFVDEVEVHRKKLADRNFFNNSTRVARWASRYVVKPWFRRTGFINPIDCNLSQHCDSLIEDLHNSKVLLLESETGAGKSIYIPGAVYQLINDHFLDPPNSNNSSLKSHAFRGLHLVPTGEQAIKNAEFIYERLKTGCDMEVDSWCSSLNKAADFEGSLTVDRTDYCYCTPFFGIQALENPNTYFHVVVLDEIHEMSPTTNYLLYLIRRKLRDKKIFRVVLLSATTSVFLRDLLKNYFVKESIGIANYGASPYPSTIMHPGHDAYSQAALKITDKGWNDNNLYNAEVSAGSPDMEQLRSRAVQLAVALCKRYLPIVMANTDKLNPVCKGCLVFLPGASDTIMASLEFNRAIESLSNSNFIKVYVVNGDNRDDIDDLSKEPDSDHIRVAFTTPLLESGVTLHGIDAVIDTGTHKFRTNRNLQNVQELELGWIDNSMRTQRKGRVGRLSSGEYFPVYSQERYREITHRDSLEAIMISKFTPADIVPYTNNEQGQMIYKTPYGLFLNLMLEAGIEGFFMHDPTRPQSNYMMPRIDYLGEAIYKSFPGLSLDLALFLLHCASNGCLLHGMIYVSCCENRHSGVKKPMKESEIRAGKKVPNRFGRDNPELHWNLWPTIVSCGKASFLQQYCEMMLNLWLLSNGKMLTGSPMERPFVDGNILKQVNQRGIQEIHRSMCALAAGLDCIGAIDFINAIFSFELSGLKKNTYYYAKNKSTTVYQLTPDRLSCFSAALVGAFGSRVLTVNPNSNGSEMELFANVLPGNKHYDVHGERVEMYDFNTLGVYNNMFVKDNDESFLTAFFHPIQPLELLITGNSYGSINDRINEADKSLTIFTLTATFSFFFDDLEILKLVASFRRYVKLQPSAVIINKQFASTLAKFINRDWNAYFKVTRDQSRAASPPITFYQSCSRTFPPN